MDTMIYLFKVNLAIAVFYLVYRAVYRKDTFFSMRRYLLLSMLLLSAMYPLIDFSQWMMQHTAMTDMALSYKNMLPEIVVYASGAEGLTADAGFFSLWESLLWGYASVACLLLLRIVFRVLQIVRLRLQSEQIFVENVQVSRLTTETSPFSFFSWIFINSEIHNEKELHEILSHELVHVRQRHSLDVLAAECLCAICWINPMMWKTRKEIQKNLEFIVDQCVINQSEIDMKSYQYHLLKLAYHPSSITLANQFNISPLKERIRMLHVKKTPKARLAAYTLVLPLAVLFLVVNNVGAVADRISHQVSHRIVDFSSEWSAPAARTVTYNRRTETVRNTSRKKEVSGIILHEETKKPLAGVNVVVHNTVTGTITDANGRFKLMIHEGDTLKFSFVGFSGFTLSVQSLPADLGTLSMSRARVELGEIYVVGYEAPLKNAQWSRKETQNENSAADDLEEVVFVAVEKMPEFPGGEPALLKYISDHINYPATAAENGIQGRVACKFTIRGDGSVGDVRVLRSVAPSLDDEAIRVLYSMPKWNPGEQRGKKVAVEYSVPVNFRLQN